MFAQPVLYYQTLSRLVALSYTPTAADMGYIADLMIAGYGSGAFTKMDACWPCIGTTATSQGMELLTQAGTFNITWAGDVAGGTFSYRGILGFAGSNTPVTSKYGYGNCNWRADTNGVKFTQNDNSFGVYINQAQSGTNNATYHFGVVGNNSTFTCVRRTGASQTQNCNNTNGSTTTLSGFTSTGLLISERTVSTAAVSYIGSNTNSVASTSTSLPTTTKFYIGCINDAGTVYNGGGFNATADSRFHFAFVGGSLGATIESAFSSALIAALTSIGAN